MIDFNSDYERGVYRDAYNEGKRDGKKKGKQEERKRILKLIDEKIKQYGYVHTLNELKEELGKWHLRKRN